jgi:hypothetical protein
MSTHIQWLSRRFVFSAALLSATYLYADGPIDNLPNQVRRIPRLGIEVPA